MEKERFESEIKKIGLEKVYYSGTFQSYTSKTYYIDNNQFNIYGVYYDKDKEKHKVFFTDTERGILNEIGIYETEEIAYDNLFEILVGIDFEHQKDAILDNLPVYRNGLQEYIIENYNCDLSKANRIIDYFASNKNVLFEFKYYVDNLKFVPLEKAYKYKGYQAETLYSYSRMTLLEVFLFLIFMEKSEYKEEALEKMKHFLHRVV